MITTSLLAVVAMAIPLNPGPGSSGARPHCYPSSRIPVLGFTGAQAQTLRIDVSPTVSLGRAPRTGPQYEFARVVAAYFLASGGFAVADNGAREVRLFGSDGEYRRTIGGRGAGPGELAFVGWSGAFRGDSIAVWDPGAGRLSRFTVGGTFANPPVRLEPLTPDWLATARALNARPSIVGVLADGSIVARVSLPTAQRLQGRASLSQDTLPLAIYSSTGQLRGKVGPVPGDEFFGGDGNSMERPFGARLRIAVRGERIATGTGVAYDIAVFDGNGGLAARHMRPEMRGASLNRAELVAYKDWYRGRFAVSAQAAVRRELDAVPYPDRMPVYENLCWDDVGRLWVQRYRAPHLPGAGVRYWDVLLTNGRWVDSVAFPPGLRVLDISRDRVLGVMVDRDGAETIQVHMIRGQESGV